MSLQPCLGRSVSRPAGASLLGEDHADRQAEPCPISATTSEERFATPEPPSHPHPFPGTHPPDCPAFHRRNAEYERRTPPSDHLKHFQPFFFPLFSSFAFPDSRASHRVVSCKCARNQMCPCRYDPRVRKSIYRQRKYIKTVRTKYPKDGFKMD